MDEAKGNGIKMQYNFRQVYNSILSDWFETSKTYVDSVLFGNFEKLDLLISCNPDSTGEEESYNTDVLIYPNPTNSNINIEILTDEKFKTIEIYNELGRKIDKIKFNDSNKIWFSVSGYQNGNYYIKLKGKNNILTKRFIKM